MRTWRAEHRKVPGESPGTLRCSARLMTPAHVVRAAGEADVLLPHHARLDLGAEGLPQVIDAILNVLLRGAGPGRDQHRVRGPRTTRPQLADAVDQVGGACRCRGRSRPAAGCSSCSGCRARAPRRPRGQLADGLLAVLRRVADVVLGRVGDLRELLPERGDDDVGVVDAQRRLRQIGDLGVGRADLERARRPRRSRPGPCCRGPRPSCR